MLNDHSKASIAQIVFYAPALALAVALRHRHGPPRMPWVILSLFCISKRFCTYITMAPFLIIQFASPVVSL